jgi:hypothetical protein
MLDRSHHGAVEHGFRNKIMCSPTIPSTFTPNIGTIPSTPAAASRLFQVYSHSSKRLKIQSVNSLCNSTFLLIVRLILLCSLVVLIMILKRIYCFMSPPHTHTPAPIECHQHCCCCRHHHNLIVVSCRTIHDGIEREVMMERDYLSFFRENNDKNSTISPIFHHYHLTIINMKAAVLPV